MGQGSPIISYVMRCSKSVRFKGMILPLFCRMRKYLVKIQETFWRNFKIFSTNFFKKENKTEWTLSVALRLMVFMNCTQAVNQRVSSQQQTRFWETQSRFQRLFTKYWLTTMVYVQGRRKVICFGDVGQLKKGTWRKTMIL